ncbi:hypothetical protein [Azospirillum sp. Marseille-Q6669]
MAAERRSGPERDPAERFAACEAAVCGCRPVVERAYRELVDCGRPDRHALEAATVVLRWHHPELDVPQALQIVERWVVAQGRLH